MTAVVSPEAKSDSASRAVMVAESPRSNCPLLSLICCATKSTVSEKPVCASEDVNSEITFRVEKSCWALAKASLPLALPVLASLTKSNVLISVPESRPNNSAIFAFGSATPLFAKDAAIDVNGETTADPGAAIRVEISFPVFMSVPPVETS